MDEKSIQYNETKTKIGIRLKNILQNCHKILYMTYVFHNKLPEYIDQFRIEYYSHDNEIMIRDIVLQCIGLE